MGSLPRARKPLFLLVLLGTVAVVSAHASDPEAPSEAARGGVIDLSRADFTAGRVVPLAGEWAWYPGELLPRGEETDGAVRGAAHHVQPPTYLSMPASLPPNRSRGVGTLTLTIVVPDSEKLYGLKIPYMASANRVFVDGEELGGSGSVQSPYIARYMPQELFFESSDSSIDIAIHVANRHHRRLVFKQAYFGSASQIRRATHLRVIRDAVLFGSLFLLAAYHLVVYFLHRRERAFLFFAGVAGISAFRLGITTERILVRLWPAMPPELMMKLGYAPVFLLLPLIILYLNELSPFDSFRRPAQIARWLAGAFTLLILATPIRVYDWAFQWGLVPLLVLAGYVLVLIFSRPTFDSERGSVVLGAGGLIILATAVSDYFREIGAIQAPELLSAGILTFLLLQAYFLAWRFRVAYRSTNELAGEVQRLNEDLESRITARTKELAEANDRLERISRTDGLTGLANRRYFDEAYEREWQSAVRRGLPLATVIADIDHFKAYNDHHGHLEGDDCLRSIADVLRGGARRRTDLVARYGGEEFMILLPDADEEAAHAVAEDLRAEVEHLGIPHAASPTASVVTVSFGVAVTHPEPEQHPNSLLRWADEALYAAKQNGRNRVEGARAAKGDAVGE